MENLDTLSCIKIQGVSVLMEKDDEPIDKIVDPAGLWTDVDGQAARINEINLTDLKHCVEYFITQMNQNPEYISPAPPKKTAAPKYKPLFTKADIGSFVTISGDEVTVGGKQRTAYWGTTDFPLSAPRCNVDNLKLKQVTGTFDGMVVFDTNVVISNPGDAQAGEIVPAAGGKSSGYKRANKGDIKALQSKIKELEEAKSALEAELAEARALGPAEAAGSGEMGKISLRTDLLALTAPIVRGLHDALKIRHPGMPGYTSKLQSVEAILSLHFQ